MRWILFATIQASALGSTIAALVYGPSPWTSVSAGGLIWLARRLFGPTKAAGRRDALERTAQTHERTAQTLDQTRCTPQQSLCDRCVPPAWTTALCSAAQRDQRGTARDPVHLVCWSERARSEPEQR